MSLSSRFIALQGIGASALSIAVQGFTAIVHFASLGAWGPVKKDKRKERRAARLAEVEEALPINVISRLREEMLSAALATEVIARAKARAKQQRDNEVALLLMI